MKDLTSWELESIVLKSVHYLYGMEGMMMLFSGEADKIEKVRKMFSEDCTSLDLYIFNEVFPTESSRKSKL